MEEAERAAGGRAQRANTTNAGPSYSLRLPAVGGRPLAFMYGTRAKQPSFRYKR